MRLTNFTDYSLRVLIYLAAQKEDERSTITEIADVYHISRNHLVKVIHELGKIGVITTIRGRGGGIKLAKSPEDINIGVLVRQTEEDFKLVECFENNDNACILTPICGLKRILNEGLKAYMDVLDQYTIADIVGDKEKYRLLLGLDNVET